MLRGAVDCIVLLVLLRLTGTRQIGQLGTSDLLLLLVLPNGVQISMNRDVITLVVGGVLITASTLVSLNDLVGTAVSRSKRLQASIDGPPELLLHIGSLDPHVLMRAYLTRHDLDTAIRCADHTSIKDVHVSNPECSESNRSPSCRDIPEVEVSPSAQKTYDADCHIHRQHQRVFDVRISDGWKGVR